MINGYEHALLNKSLAYFSPYYQFDSIIQIELVKTRWAIPDADSHNVFSYLVNNGYFRVLTHGSSVGFLMDRGRLLQDYKTLDAFLEWEKDQKILDTRLKETAYRSYIVNRILMILAIPVGVYSVLQIFDFWQEHDFDYLNFVYSLVGASIALILRWLLSLLWKSREEAKKN